MKKYLYIFLMISSFSGCQHLYKIVQDPETGTPIVEPSEFTESALSAFENFAPAVPFGTTVSVLLNGLLGVGAFWYKRQKSTIQTLFDTTAAGIEIYAETVADLPDPYGKKLKAILQKQHAYFEQSDLAAKEVKKITKRLSDLSAPDLLEN